MARQIRPTFKNTNNDKIKVTYCSVPKNRPNYVDSQSHKKSL